MKINDIIAVLEKGIPIKLAQSWDNVGLLIGDGTADVKKVLVTIDITKLVLDEAVATGANLILSYHPTIWNPLKTVTPDGPGSIVYELIRNNIAVYSMHTAFDAVAGGVNDCLAQMIGIKNPKPIGDWVQSPAMPSYKIVVFVPEKEYYKVASAMWDAGAGHIGNYDRCGFELAGTGTFRPLAGSNPVIGSQGKQEYVEEVRFETIVTQSALAGVIEALRASHPYEEPAFDVISLSNADRFGLGRMGELAKAASLDDIVLQIKKATGAKAVGIVGPAKRKIKTAAVCAGSCGAILNLVIAGGVELYVTGELKHHQAVAAREAGITCLCLSHSVSERFALVKIVQLLQKSLTDVKITQSKKDSDPFVWKEI
ncbi:MAG: Nif3-like dinuclear metal center hexameric protein [Planctomycetes bacterium GWF2_50_10]|nr:MAG: Nif3-like dinuclear metal center hexameric protein [Planctomycetes bacterium GWF2_50_10]